jgi:ADP-ribosyl-[dinitrogen reductase] hydrolase
VCEERFDRALGALLGTFVGDALGMPFEGAPPLRAPEPLDADTIAAMAGAIAGARFGASAIPRRWVEPLEDGERGRTHVEALAERLAPLHSPLT